MRSWVAAQRSPRPSSCQAPRDARGVRRGRSWVPREPDLPRVPTVAGTVTAGPTESARGSRASRGRSKLSLPAGTRGEGLFRLASGSPKERSGGSVLWRPPPPPAYEGGRAEHPPASPPPAAPPPARTPSPRRCLCVARAPPAGSAALGPTRRAATGRVARLASLFPCGSSWLQGAAGSSLGLISL